MAMTRDTVVLVSGYQGIIGVAKEFGELIFMLLYQFIASVVFGKKFSGLAFGPLILFPLVMAGFLRVRNSVTNKLLQQRNEAQTDVVDSVNDYVDSYQLISDYRKEEMCIRDFGKCVKVLNTASREAGVVLKNNAYFAKWCSIVTIAVWTFVGGGLVITGDLSLGMFLANINIFGKIGKAWGQIYSCFLSIMGTFPALQNVVTSMNLKTDVRTRMALWNRTEFLEIRESHRLAISKDNQSDGRLPIDKMKLIIGNIPFVYETTSPFGARRKIQLNHPGVAEMEQGTFNLFMGPSGGGKTTLLRILGGDVLPDPSLIGQGEKDKGRLFVPSHLRMLHVSAPLFYKGTLLTNLTFGIAAGGEDDGSRERVKAVAQRVGVDASVLSYLSPGNESDTHDWSAVFSTTQCQKLSIVRALVSNPEVLCMHQPCQIFNDQRARHIMSVFRAFVDDRGIEQLLPPSTRRPRTVVMTTGSVASLKFADKIFSVSEKGIKEMENNDHTKQLLA